MRLRNTVSGVVVNVRDDHPIVNDSQWESADAEPKKPRGKKTAE